MAIDPVCGMTVDPATTPHRLEREGETVYFCSAGCVERFRQAGAPAPAAEPAAPAASPVPVQWTCPMHPEIVRDSPGACPICGMALERRTVQATEEPSDELVDM